MPLADHDRAAGLDLEVRGLDRHRALQQQRKQRPRTIALRFANEARVPRHAVEAHEVKTRVFSARAIERETCVLETERLPKRQDAGQETAFFVCMDAGATSNVRSYRLGMTGYPAYSW